MSQKISLKKFLIIFLIFIISILIYKVNTSSTIIFHHIKTICIPNKYVCIRTYIGENFIEYNKTVFAMNEINYSINNNTDILFINKLFNDKMYNCLPKNTYTDYTCTDYNIWIVYMLIILFCIVLCNEKDNEKDNEKNNELKI